MHLHEIKAPKGARKRKKIVGRGPGSGHGQTSCRGENGQKARSTGSFSYGACEGGQMRLIRRLPKMGFRSHRPVLNQVVNLDQLSSLESGAVVNAALLKSKGLIQSLNKPFKILADGSIKQPLIIEEGAISKAAQEKIVKAGGKINITK